MPNNSQRKNYLMYLADRALHHIDPSKTILRADSQIADSYNGQIASFAVAVSQSGLCPALSSYYKESNNDTRTVNRQPILEIISRMIHADTQMPAELRDIENASNLMRKAVFWANDKCRSRILRQEVIDCAIALKQVVRTYKLVES